MYTCCTQVCTHAFTVIKGNASIPKHLEILRYIYDYFLFLSNPLQSLLKYYYVTQNAQSFPELIFTIVREKNVIEREGSKC